MKLVSRSQWGARDYRLPSGATLYSGSQRRGVKLHYLGTAYSDRTHDRCDDYVRQLQASHMDGNGWSDIGYSFVVCTHGYVYEGRGLRRRNSANGNTTLNNQDYAVCLLVGSSGLTQPTDVQLHGARDAIDYCRREGPAGTWLGGHRDGYATACPGEAVYAWVKKGAPRPTNTSEEDDDMPLTPQDKKDIAAEVLAQIKANPVVLYDAVMRTDRATPPPGKESKDNPTWAMESIGREAAGRAANAEAVALRVEKKLTALEQTGLTEAQIEAFADRLLDKMSGRLTN